MLAHGPCDAATASRNMGHVATVRDVAPAAHLVGPNIVGADDVAVFFRDEGLSIAVGPVMQAIHLRHVWRKSIGLPGSEDRFHDRPNRCVITSRGGPDLNQSLFLDFKYLQPFIPSDW